MVEDLNDIQISSNVGGELALSPYFPTIFFAGEKNTDAKDLIVSTVTSSGVEGVIDSQIDSILKDITYITSNNVYGDYEIKTSTEINNITTGIYSTFEYYLISSKINTQTKFNITTKLSWLSSTQVSYYNDAIFRDTVNNLNNILKLYYSVVPYTNNLDNILYFSNSKMYALYDDVYCSSEIVLGDLIYDIEVGYGRIAYVLGDVYSTIDNYISIGVGVYSTKINMLSVVNDVEDTPGSITSIQNDVFSTIIGSVNISYDIRLNSLYIVNFSLYYEDYTYLGDYLYVDMLDYLFTIKTSDSYFEVDGVRLTTEFDSIANGVRARCLITTAFVSTSEVVVKIVASNSIGDVFFEYYYLLFGYSVELDNNILFDYNRNVLVRGCATNTVECPNTECNSFTFTTINYPSYNLGASISCVVSEDLSAEIVPQSTAFFYGRSYKITVSNIKDNSGNYLTPVVMEFTIEVK